METRKMNRAYFAARIARLNRLTGQSFDFEMGSRYTSYKLCKDSTQSRVILYAKTRAEFDAAITGMIEMAWIMQNP